MSLLQNIIINIFAPFVINNVNTLKPLVIPPIIKEPEKQEQLQQLYNDSNSYQALASWYGPGFDGNLTASGKVFNQYDLTVAHKTYPFGTPLKITYKGNSVVVIVTDRGPYEGRRDIDLSKGTAEAIGFDGVDTVTITELK